MVEIIKRQEMQPTEKQTIRHEKCQISHNDFGHICVRGFDEPSSENICDIGRENCPKDSLNRVCRDFISTPKYNCEHYKTVSTGNEHLIVFDRETSNKLIAFIIKTNSTFELKELLKNIIKRSSGLPF